MGKVEKLPGSKPLGPRLGSETPFVAGGPKANKRAVGAAQSAMRYSNPDMPPISVKKDIIQKVEADVEMSRSFDDLVGSASLEVTVLQPGDLTEGETIVFGNVVPATLENMFPEPSLDPFFPESSLRAVTEISRVYPGGRRISWEALQDRESVDDYDSQELLDFGTSAIDKSDTIR